MLATIMTLGAMAQTTANDVLSVARKANDYFMAKYADPTLPTNVKKVRPTAALHRLCNDMGRFPQMEPQKRHEYM